MTAQASRTGNRERRLTRRLTWLAVVMRILRSRGFRGQVVVDAVVLAALAGLGRDMRLRAFARARELGRKLDQRAGRAVKAAKR